jgi:hypothetical protein
VTSRMGTEKPLTFFTGYDGEDKRSSLAGRSLDRFAEESNESDGEKACKLSKHSCHGYF